MKKLRGNKKGFTLIELIVVMIIIGILVLLATPKFLRYVKDANVTSLRVDAKVIGDADLYQNLKAYDEAGKDRLKSRGQEYTIKDIESGIVYSSTGEMEKEENKKAYDHPIFNEAIDEKALKPDFGGGEKFEFDKWKLAMASTYESTTGEKVTKMENDQLVVDEDAGGYKAFMATKYAALNSEILTNHIRNTRHGVQNFIVATSGSTEGQAYYMGYVKDGDDIANVSLIPSNSKLKK